MWLGILTILVAVSLAVYVVCTPSEFRAERSTRIEGPAAVVFAQVNDLHVWEAWSPWLKIDPGTTFQYDGPDSGVGSTVRWKGNPSVGEGSTTILESEASRRIRLLAKSIRPVQAEFDVDFRFQEENDTCLVIWQVIGKRLTLDKIFGIVVSLEQTIGRDLEQGLANLKEWVEKKTKAPG